MSLIWLEECAPDIQTDLTVATMLRIREEKNPLTLVSFVEQPVLVYKTLLQEFVRVTQMEQIKGIMNQCCETLWIQN